MAARLSVDTSAAVSVSSHGRDGKDGKDREDGKELHCWLSVVIVAPSM